MRLKIACDLSLALFILSLPQVQSQTAEGSTVAQNPTAQREQADTLTDKLKRIKRVYVDSFGEDATSRQIQAMVINALSESRRFILTENKDRADATMRGSTLEQTHQETRSSTEVTVARSTAIADASKSTETINEARLAVRLVSTDGDVIWTTTQESKGAKYKGASADVADKVVKQLLRDLEKAEKRREAIQQK